MGRHIHDVQAFFGPAAAAMEEHYREMAKVTDRAHPGLGSIGVGTTYYHRLFDSGQIEQVLIEELHRVEVAALADELGDLAEAAGHVPILEPAGDK